VRPCSPGDVWGLRHSVLRPHQRADEVHWDSDDAPGSAHFCAEGPAGEVVSVGSVHPEDAPWPSGAAAQWRLRGMATLPEFRGRGAGGAVLEAVVAHVARQGGGLLWCNARLPAVPFYRRAGFAERGEPWEEPAIGPHVVMWTWVEATPPPGDTGSPAG